MMVPECCEVKMMGREAVLYSDKSRLYTNASFPTGPTSTGHSVLIHRGGCRHVAGAKSIRVHTDIRTGKADGKGGRSGIICRSVYENSRFFSRRLRKKSGGGRQAVVTHSTLDRNISLENAEYESPECPIAVIKAVKILEAQAEHSGTADCFFASQYSLPHIRALRQYHTGHARSRVSLLRAPDLTSRNCAS